MIRAAPAPVRVEVQRDRNQVEIEWTDGHCSVFPTRYLRGFCPCAVCQGHALGSWTFIDSASTIDVSGIEEVGLYALQIKWSDGHDTGIYSWSILRELCPCGPCQDAAGPGHAMRVYPDAQPQSPTT